MNDPVPSARTTVAAAPEARYFNRELSWLAFNERVLARVPAGKVYTARDIAEDPHYRARDMILRQATRDGDTVRIWCEDDRHHSIFGAIEQTVRAV